MDKRLETVFGIAMALYMASAELPICRTATMTPEAEALRSSCLSRSENGAYQITVSEGDPLSEACRPFIRNAQELQENQSHARLALRGSDGMVKTGNYRSVPLRECRDFRTRTS